MLWKDMVFVLMFGISTSFEIRLRDPNDVYYSLDPEQIEMKILSRVGRTLRKPKIELSIAGLESLFSWNDLIQGQQRIGVGFQLYQGRRYAENVVLYTPRDGIYRVVGLKDATQYSGSIRIIRDQLQIQPTNSTKDVYQFRLDTPRIIQQRELTQIAGFLKKLSPNKIKLDSFSVTFKMTRRIREHYILEVYNLNESSVITKTEVHIVPNSKTIILNDLPSNSIMRMVLKRFNSSSSSEDATTSYLFTGSITSGDKDMLAASSISRITMFNKNRFDQSQHPNNNQYEDEKTVPCHVVNRRPFDGYPCPQSQVCLPLHWRCDGQQDCPGGLDEVGCESFSLRTESNAFKPSKLCKAEEASCTYNNETMCLPNKWLCDGRQDCPDGWDERKENCPPKISKYTLPGLTNGIRRITNLLLRCRGAHFRCRSGECISDRSICDGVNNCDDGSDELYCDDDDDSDEDEYNNYEPDYETDFDFKCHPRYEFKCYRSYSYSVSRRCIPKAWLCDAFQDCPYGEDENTNFCSHQHLFQGYFKR